MNKNKIYFIVSFAILTIYTSANDIDYIFTNNWFINIGISNTDPVYFKKIDSSFLTNVYLRSYDNSGFYIDHLDDGKIITLQQGENKVIDIEFNNKNNKIIRKDTPISLVYTKIDKSDDLYEGIWKTNFKQKFTVKKIINNDWDFAMFFPGDPMSAIKRGWYLFKQISGSTYESCDLFQDSKLRLIIIDDTKIKIIPLFKKDEYINMYDSVYAWKQIKENK